jgi:hypothetical protein
MIFRPPSDGRGVHPRLSGSVNLGGIQIGKPLDKHIRKTLQRLPVTPPFISAMTKMKELEAGSL